jgi:hypothetical protein
MKDKPIIQEKWYLVNLETKEVISRYGYPSEDIALLNTKRWNKTKYKVLKKSDVPKNFKVIEKKSDFNK